MSFKWMDPEDVSTQVRLLWERLPGIAGVKPGTREGMPLESGATSAPSVSIAPQFSAQKRLAASGSTQPLLVITGGEPLLFQDRLIVLLQFLPRWFVEVETNGTIVPLRELTAGVSQFNVSPKLANSGQDLHKRRVREAISAFLRSAKAWWKFVVCSAEDIAEVLRWVEDFGLPRERVLLMPEGMTRARLAETVPLVKALATQYGFGFTHRLHILIWNGERGR